MNSTLPSVALENVTVQNTGRNGAQLSGVDWTIGGGEFWIVAGRPGDGKSDLIATAAGLRRPTEGNVSLFGKDLAESNEQELAEMRNKVGFVFENGGRLFRGLTALENILLPLVYNRQLPFHELKEVGLAALESVQLSHLGHRLVEHIDRPLHQRIALARALVLKPEVLFLDNPLFTPDRREFAWWRHWLAEGKGNLAKPDDNPNSMVLATSEFRQAHELDARFAVIDSEGWHLIGNRDELKSHPNPTARELLMETP